MLLTKYLDTWVLEAGYFYGCRLLDGGCVPSPHLHCFQIINCQELDQLINEYKDIGFPLDRCKPKVIYSAGSIPYDNNFFDAIKFVNAMIVLNYEN